jgi:tagatose kinase
MDAMKSIWTMGEMLVEVMRPHPNMPLNTPGVFLGPFPSGAPAILIDTVARLGHPAGIIGGVGEDDFGRCLLDRLEADGVDCTRVWRDPRRSTAVAFVTYFDDGSRKFIFHIDGTAATPLEDSNPTLRTWGVPDFTPAWFHVMGCSLMVNDSLRAAILATMASFHARGARISFDPNIRPELLAGRSLLDVVAPVLEVCSLLLPGEAELALLTGKTGVENAVEHLFATTALETVVVKRGRQGCSICTHTQYVGCTRSGVLDVPAYPVHEVDPTGAGDCFDGAFLCGLLEDLPLEECGRMACAAGALNAAAFGPMEGKISRETVGKVLREGHVGEV